MSRGSENENGGQLFFMSIRGLKTGEKVHITQSKPVEGQDGKYEVLKPINKIAGRLSKLEVKSRVWEGETYEELRIWLKDPNAGDPVAGGETYCLSCGVNGIGRNLINTLASIDGEIGELMISVYTNKTSGMPSLYVEHNGAKIGWKYTFDDLKQYIKKVEKKSKDATGKVVKTQVNEYFDLNEFLLKIFKEELPKKVRSGGGASAPKAKPHPLEVTTEEGAGAPDAGDDLPF